MAPLITNLIECDWEKNLAEVISAECFCNFDLYLQKIIWYFSLKGAIMTCCTCLLLIKMVKTEAIESKP